MKTELSIVKNAKIAGGIYNMVLRFENSCKDCKSKEIFKASPGQFYMLKARGSFMSLYRPISVFDYGDDYLSFLYSVSGRGTAYFSNMQEGSKLDVHGPYGNGWNSVDSTEQNKSKSTLLLAGGIGMAPLCRLAKTKSYDLYVGLRKAQYSADELKALKSLIPAPNLHLIEGGYITDIPDYAKYSRVFVCGPEPMYAALSKLEMPVYASFERHMGCGIGACKSCSIRPAGNSLTIENAKMYSCCKDGPVFNLGDIDLGGAKLVK